MPCCVWPNKPSIEQLAEYCEGKVTMTLDVMGALAFILHLHNGGGRRDAEYQWYELQFVEFGKVIDS